MSSLNFEKKHEDIGTHICVDIVDAEYKYLNSDVIVLELLSAMSRMSLSTEITKTIKKFKPQGITGFLLLEESHISIHTYPETGRAFIDIFTCGCCCKPEQSIGIITSILGGRIAKKYTMLRGDFMIATKEEISPGV